MIKCISLWQPWAYFVLKGYKLIETRLHARMKGLAGQRIAIHAAQRFDMDAPKLAKPWLSPEIIQYSNPANPRLVFGHIICTAHVDKAEWIDTDQLNASFAARIDCVNYRRFGLFLSDIQRLDTPIKCKGRQGIFLVDIDS